MSHVPTSIDVKTDLIRGIMASLSKDGFKDANYKIFIKNAKKNLKFLKNKIGVEKYNKVIGIISKSGNKNNPIEKRREDLLTASCLV